MPLPRSLAVVRIEASRHAVGFLLRLRKALLAAGTRIDETAATIGHRDPHPDRQHRGAHPDGVGTECADRVRAQLYACKFSVDVEGTGTDCAPRSTCWCATTASARARCWPRSARAAILSAGAGARSGGAGDAPPVESVAPGASGMLRLAQSMARALRPFQRLATTIGSVAGSRCSHRLLLGRERGGSQGNTLSARGTRRCIRSCTSRALHLHEPGARAVSIATPAAMMPRRAAVCYLQLLLADAARQRRARMPVARHGCLGLQLPAGQRARLVRAGRRGRAAWLQSAASSMPRTTDGARESARRPEAAAAGARSDRWRPPAPACCRVRRPNGRRRARCCSSASGQARCRSQALRIGHTTS